MTSHCLYFLLFFFNDPATTEIYTLSLHDARSDLADRRRRVHAPRDATRAVRRAAAAESIRRHRVGLMRGPCRRPRRRRRSEEHTSELQSRPHLVCRLLLEKKKQSDIFLHAHNERI